MVLVTAVLTCGLLCTGGIKPLKRPKKTLTKAGRKYHKPFSNDQAMKGCIPQPLVQLFTSFLQFFLQFFYSFFYSFFFTVFLQFFFVFLQFFFVFSQFFTVFHKAVEWAGDFGAGDLGGLQWPRGNVHQKGTGALARRVRGPSHQPPPPPPAVSHGGGGGGFAARGPRSPERTSPVPSVTDSRIESRVRHMSPPRPPPLPRAPGHLRGRGCPAPEVSGPSRCCCAGKRCSTSTTRGRGPPRPRPRLRRAGGSTRRCRSPARGRCGGWEGASCRSGAVASPQCAPPPPSASGRQRPKRGLCTQRQRGGGGAGGPQFVAVVPPFPAISPNLPQSFAVFRNSASGLDAP